MTEIHTKWMGEALALAQQAATLDEVPVGAVVVYENRIVGRGFNRPISNCDPSAHAEIMALRDAATNLQNYRLPGCTLYVTIEPCTMCVGALIHARIDTLVFGASEPRAGAVISQQQLLNADYFNHKITLIEGVLAPQCSQIMSSFFKSRR